MIVNFQYICGQLGIIERFKYRFFCNKVGNKICNFFENTGLLQAVYVREVSSNTLDNCIDSKAIINRNYSAKTA